MNLSQFFEHWCIVENPFKGEEARHDSVFARIGIGSPDGSARSLPESQPRVIRDEPVGPAAAMPTNNGGPVPVTTHSDFDKILGDLARPSTAIVFGEKGSGKTAIRLQIADRVARHNQWNPEAKVLLVAAKYALPVWPHAGGVGLCEYVQHLSMIDYVAVSGTKEGRVIEYVDHLHEHFVDPCVIENAAYMPPQRPGFSIEMKPQSIADYTFRG